MLQKRFRTGALKMNNEIEYADLTRSLPPALKHDPKMIALSEIIAGELQKTSKIIRQNMIYARIDELDEETLDVLAYDLHVDWYNYGYSIDAKRAVIKDSVRVHKRMGTLYAVRTALGSVYPESEVEEWFDYGGRPHTFRVVLDVTNAKAPAEYFSIKNAVESYKRLSAQMESLIYQCRIAIDIATETEMFNHHAGYTGRRIAGTYPQRNFIAGIGGGRVNIGPTGQDFISKNAPAGTKPQRSTVAALRESVLQASGEGVRFSFRTAATGQSKAGTKPQTSTGGSVAAAAVETSATTEAYRFLSKQAGTEPGRSTTAEGERGGIVPTITGESFYFRVKRCGTSFCKVQ